MKYPLVSALLLSEGNEFKDAMSDVRKKANEYIKQQSDIVLKKLSNKLKNDLDQKYLISNFEMKLGKFRGKYFITSCKISLKPDGSHFDSEEDVEEVLNYLKDTYSPKFKLKSISDGEAHLNIR